ncbi:sensor histidine kinase [Sphingobacterium sp. HJSM2_6]|uniref:sensor histidine kinase n=1 Tax=Sphingobacterium sp. HJSM2_6 TaxID=3366264 RepID=UPI003BC2567B
MNKSVSNLGFWFKKIFLETLVIVVLCVIFVRFGQEINRSIGLFFVVIPYGYFLYSTHYYFLLEKRYEGKFNAFTYYTSSLLIALTGYICLALLIQILATSTRYHADLFVFCSIYYLLIIPITIHQFDKKNKNKEQLSSLQKDLGKSEADLKLIQSQINPHFLFNVMNSIYGLAIQENASKTADSVQRLSSMMRFMLFENQKEHILLSRDLTYLKEYIEIQSLRIDQSDQIKLEYEISEIFEEYYIGPMLLIPFVENAFKHGISMVNPSWIKINAELIDAQLKFSVYNSIHKLQENDLERTKSGIGLENVKSRLNLLYPNKHMLIIEQNQQEFFVFLTIDLETSSKRESIS